MLNAEKTSTNLIVNSKSCTGNNYVVAQVIKIILIYEQNGLENKNKQNSI